MKKRNIDDALANNLYVYEVNIGWLCDYFGSSSDKLNEWMEDNDLEEDDYLLDMLSNLGGVLIDIGLDRQKLIDSYRSLFKLCERLISCREMHAWEIKPCWQVYEVLRKNVNDIRIEPLHTEKTYEKTLKGEVAMLRKAARVFRAGLDELDDFLELGNKEKKWLIELGDSLVKTASLPINKPYRSVCELILIYKFASIYCECQGKTAQESCLTELSDLNKAMQDRKQN